MIKVYIKNIVAIIVILIGAVACSDSMWDDLPSPVADFISEYFPQQALESEGWNDDVFYVHMKNSTVMSFDTNYKWRSINGYGSTLPRMLLFDQLPPALYEYLQSMDSTDDVYRVDRNSSRYIVELAESPVIYNIADESITVPMKLDAIGQILNYESY